MSNIQFASSVKFCQESFKEYLENENTAGMGILTPSNCITLSFKFPNVKLILFCGLKYCRDLPDLFHAPNYYPLCPRHAIARTSRGGSVCRVLLMRADGAGSAATSGGQRQRNVIMKTHLSLGTTKVVNKL